MHAQYMSYGVMEGLFDAGVNGKAMMTVKRLVQMYSGATSVVRNNCKMSKTLRDSILSPTFVSDG